MTASHVTLSAFQYSADLAKEMRSHAAGNTTASERGHSADESAHEPEQDFREAFRRQLNESGAAPQRVKPSVESDAANVRQKEAPSSKPAAVPPTNLGQQTASSKIVPDNLKTVPTAPPSIAHSTAAGARQQAPASAAGQPRKTKDAVESEPDDEQPTFPLSVGEQQPVLAIARETDDHAAAPDEYVAASGSDEVEAAIPAVNAASAVTGDLVMAMRIESPDKTAAEAPRTANAVPVAGIPSNTASLLRGQMAGADSSQAAQRHEGSIPAIAGTAAATESATSSQAEKGERAAAGEGTNPVDFEAEFAKFRSEPVRGARVQIDGSNNERVDIRLLERGGALSVSVRSGDAALTRALQEHSPELNTRLTTEHFRTELWMPGSGKQGPGRTFEDGRGQSQGGFSGEGAPDQRQRGKQSNEPAWIEDFENHRTAFQKRIEYTWHQ